MTRLATITLAAIATTANAGAICRDECSPCGFRPVSQLEPCECDDDETAVAGSSAGGGLAAPIDVSPMILGSGSWLAIANRRDANRPWWVHDDRIFDRSTGNPPVDFAKSPTVDQSAIPEPSSLVAMAGLFLCFLMRWKRVHA